MAGRASVLFVASLALALPAVAVETRSVVYARPDGEELKATLFLPGKAAPPDEGLPAVLLIHGGGWLTGTRLRVRWYGMRFAREGYAAMAISYRTMPGHDFDDCYADVRAAHAWLEDQSQDLGIDPSRIAAMGTSAGGHLALMMATAPCVEGAGASVQRLRAAVSMYGPTQLEYFADPSYVFGVNSAVAALMRRFVRADDEDDVEAYRRASPVALVCRQTAPALLIHGLEDGVVPFEQSALMHSALRAEGVPSRLVAVAGVGHGFDLLHRQKREQAMTEILGFLESHMPAGDANG